MPDPTPNPQPLVTPPAQPDTSTTVTPVTTQPAPPSQTKPGEITLEAKQHADTVTELGKLFDEIQGEPPGKVPGQEPAKTPTQTPGQTPGQEPPKSTPVGSDDFTKRVDGVKAPDGAHPNVASGLEQLKKDAKEQYTRAETLQTQLKEVQQKLAQYETDQKSGKLPENVEKELNALRERVRETDYQSDPDFQKNYVQPVVKAENDIMGLLKQAGLKDEAIKDIQANGGIITMSQSGEKAGIKENPDMTMAEWVESVLLAKTPSVFRQRILSKLSNAQDIIEKGRSELEDFRANSEQRHTARMQKLTQEFDAGRQSALDSLGDLAKPKQITTDMSPEDQQAATEHNKLLHDAQNKFQAYLKVAQDPKTAGEILVKATQADVLLGLYKRSQDTVKSLQGKLDAIKASGSHSKAGDHAPPASQEKPTTGTLLKETTEDAMSKLFRQHEATT